MSELSFSQMARNRAALYHWFAHAFVAPPTEPEVVDLRQGPARRMLDLLAQSPDAAAGVAAMLAVLAADTPPVVVSRIGIAHCRLFDGVGGHDTAPPYRSVYTSEGGLLCQQATAEMDRLLRQHRLRLDERLCEPADHLAIQLETMSQLACRAAEGDDQPDAALDALRAEQADFLASQLLSWLAGFARRVAEVDALGYHAGLASVLQAVLVQDLEYLTDAVPA